MRRGRVPVAVASLLVAGCASYQLEPFATTHPANPDGPSAPARPPSRTLVYTRSDIPSTAAVPSVPAPPHEGGTSPTVVGEGEVIATVAQSGQIVLDHEEIKGFMEAMTMGYRIDPPALLEGLKPGDRVRFTIDVQKRAITAIERVK